MNLDEDLDKNTDITNDELVAFMGHLRDIPPMADWRTFVPEEKAYTGGFWSPPIQEMCISAAKGF